MRFDILTLFPGLFDAFRQVGVLGRAVERGLVEIALHDLRDWSGNRWRQVDDEPYGGGAGMVIQAPPVVAAAHEIETSGVPPRRILLSPRGRLLDQRVVEELAAEERLLILCGRYEGFDERVSEILSPDEISIGDYILGGGEVAAMVLMEAVARLEPGVVGDPQSVVADSFTDGLLDFPCYTRPLEVEGHEVPEVLRSGNHELVRRWRLERAVQATVTRRPDLINRYWDGYSAEVRDLVLRIQEQDPGPQGEAT
jgi:tRNA (guanine37-N1)-methyltransferase